MRRDDGAREHLAGFAGQTLAFECFALPPFNAEILPDGGLARTDADREPAVRVRLALPGSTLEAIRVTGDAALAEALRMVLRRVRPDPEELLAHWLGDAAAHRAGQAARGFAGWQREAGRRLVENLIEYTVEERRAVVRRAEFQGWASDVDALARALERLDARVSGLEDAP